MWMSVKCESNGPRKFRTVLVLTNKRQSGLHFLEFLTMLRVKFISLFAGGFDCLVLNPA
jgi:hypothetical protein